MHHNSEIYARLKVKYQTLNGKLNVFKFILFNI